MKYHLFTIEGEGRFDLDMLRRALCWPACRSDAESIEPQRTERRRIDLATPRKPTATNLDDFRLRGWEILQSERRG